MDHCKGDENNRYKSFTFVTVKAFGKKGWHFVGIHNIIMITVLIQNDFPTPAWTFIDNTVPSMEIDDNNLVFTENTLKP